MKTYIKDILNKRKQLSKEVYVFLSENICHKIETLKEFQMAENVLFFYPYLGEVNILPLAKKTLETGKNVYFPKVISDTEMNFIKVRNLDDFNEGYKGIKEPKEGEIFDTEHILTKTVMILPGSAFDISGNRAGYGKGYYDRYLSDCYKNITKVGICFALQMLTEIPDVKLWDIPMDYVINEETIIRRN